MLVVQEIFGVHEHIKDVTRRLAKQGYLAIAPELYARQGDVSTMSVPDILANVVVESAGCAGHGRSRCGCRLGCEEWWRRQAGHHRLLLGWPDRLDVRRTQSVRWRPASPGTATSRRGHYPGDKGAIEVVGRIKAPVLGLYGGADGGIPNDTLEKMRAALKAAGNDRSEIIIYPDTPHAFHADYRPSYRKEQAEDGWKRLSAWFKQYLA